MPKELVAGMVMTGNSNLDDAKPGKDFLELERPAATVAAEPTGELPRALVGAGGFDGEVVQAGPDRPGFSITASTGDRPSHLPAAFVVDPNNPSRDSTIRACDEPMVTVTATHMRRPITTPCIIVTGRVVRMTPRALARFQSFPDWYELPDNLALACRGIGNAVPPLLYQRVIEAQG